MDIDQELANLEDGIRRLKIEYEIFFNGGSTKMPFDLRWRVEALIKKYNDFGNMSYAQRFRYNTLAAKFHSYSDLWRRMVKTKEEGKPGQVTLPTTERGELGQKQALGDRLICRFVFSDPELEVEKLRNLYKSLIEARRECGEKPDALHFQSFKKFLVRKTSKLKDQFKSDSVCYTVSIEFGKVKFTAKGRF